MQDAWLAFARSGNPSTAERGEWPRYHAQQRTVVLLDGEDSARSERDRRREEIALWD
jgi:para-nitrobenzyl esterase